MKDETKYVVLRSALAIAGPPAIIAAYSLLSRWPAALYGAASDYVFLILSVLIGFVGFCTVPLREGIRGWFCLPYILGMGALVFVIWCAIVSVFPDPKLAMEEAQQLPATYLLKAALSAKC